MEGTINALSRLIPIPAGDFVTAVMPPCWSHLPAPGSSADERMSMLSETQAALSSHFHRAPITILHPLRVRPWYNTHTLPPPHLAGSGMKKFRSQLLHHSCSRRCLPPVRCDCSSANPASPHSL